MSQIHRITQSQHNGADGFKIEWDMTAMNKSFAEFRAVGMTAMRFPTTITQADRVSTTEIDDGWRVGVFVPTEGFAAAGIGRPAKWVKDQFGKLFSE